MRVSRSGAWTSVIRPHSKRVRSRSSSVVSFFGARSEVMTICLLALCSVLNVWKNSSCVRSARSRNWMSSISRKSMSRNRRRNSSARPGVHEVDELVRELLGADVAHPDVGEHPRRVVADGVQQVGLAQARVAVDEQRVVGAGRRLGDGDGRGVGEPVAVADDEAVEDVLGVQSRVRAGRRAGPRRTGRRPPRRRGRSAVARLAASSAVSTAVPVGLVELEGQDGGLVARRPSPARRRGGGGPAGDRAQRREGAGRRRAPTAAARTRAPTRAGRRRAPRRRCARRRRGPGSAGPPRGGRPRPSTRDAGSAGPRPPGSGPASAGASSSWTATRMSRPSCSDRASASTRRIRDSSTAWVNPFGAASTMVSSKRPSGRVRLSIAFCCGDRLAASRSRIWSQTVARSTVASAMAASSSSCVVRLPHRRAPAIGVRAAPRGGGPPSGSECGHPDTTVPHRCPQAVHNRRRTPDRSEGTDRSRSVLAGQDGEEARASRCGVRRTETSVRAAGPVGTGPEQRRR